MTDKQTVDLFTVGLVVGENGEMEANNKEELVQYLAENKFIKPVNYYFLVATPTIQKTTKSGLIHFADSTLENALVGNNIGRIIGIGGTVGGQTGNLFDCRDLRIGDYIGYNPHAGLPENYRGHKVICIADEAIRITVPDPTQHTDGIFKAFGIEGMNKC